MEREENSNQRHRSKGNRGSSSAVVIQEPGNAANNIVNPNNDNDNDNANINNMMPTPYVRRDPELLVPITSILRIMRRILPSHAKVSEDVKETIQECVSEYVSFITGEANERCHREHRKTVTAEDILYAHSKLGFDDYVGPLTLFLNRYRDREATHTAVHGDPSVRRTTFFPDVQGQGPLPMLTHAPHPPPPPPINPAFQVGADQQGFFNPALMMNNDYYFQNAPSTASHGSGPDIGGSSSNAEFAGALPPPGFYPPSHGQ